MLKYNYAMKRFCFLVILLLFTLVLAGCASGAREVPEDYKNLKNPLKSGDIDQRRAEDIYVRRCSACHGINGRGDGKMAGKMQPPPTNFTNELLMVQRTDGELFYWIKEGKQGSAMVPFGALPAPDIWLLIKYIRSLPDKK